MEKLRGLASPVEKLALDPNNTRVHDADNLRAIEGSLREFGQVSPLVANTRNNQVVVGNGRLVVAKRMGWSHVAVVWRDLTAKQQRALSIADNRSAELADWDLERLEAELVGMEVEDGDLFADLLLNELCESSGAIIEGEVVLRPIDTRPPPSMSWVLVGIPTVRFGEIADVIEAMGGIEDVIIETTSNDG